MHESFLGYKNFRYLKLAAVATLLAALGYAWHDPADGPNGGTWLGYTLGGVGAAIILALLWLGVRKRQFGPRQDRMLGWVSAHVYFGAALLVIVTLHTGFQLGWNVHSLAYVLMIAVIASGFWGIWNYARLPARITENRQGVAPESLMEEVGNIDRECLTLAARLGAETHERILHAVENTAVGGGARAQLSSRARLASHDAAVQALREELAHAAVAGEAENLQALLDTMARKRELVQRLQRDVQQRALLEVWLYLHVPLSVALLAALLAHVVSVFFYW